MIVSLNRLCKSRLRNEANEIRSRADHRYDMIVRFLELRVVGFEPLEGAKNKKPRSSLKDELNECRRSLVATVLQEVGVSVC